MPIVSRSFFLLLLQKSVYKYRHEGLHPFVSAVFVQDALTGDGVANVLDCPQIQMTARKEQDRSNCSFWSDANEWERNVARE
jgi:hypothetical protein